MVNRRANRLAVVCEVKDIPKVFDWCIRSAPWYKKLFSGISECIETCFQFDITVILVSESRIKELNLRYRNKARVTDVLSFAYEEKGILQSAEIYLCPSQALRQHTRFRTTPEQEIARLFFHGVFHALGYDHMRAAERIIMRKKEHCAMDASHKKELW